MIKYYFVTWDELFERCEKILKEMKQEVDIINGKEKCIYKICGIYSKNSIIIASIFEKIYYSYFKFEVTYFSNQADVFIKDIIKSDNDYIDANKPLYGCFNYVINPNEKDLGVIVFPWEHADYNEDILSILKFENVEESEENIKLLRNNIKYFFEKL